MQALGVEEVGIFRAPDAVGFPVGWLTPWTMTIRYTEFTPLDFWVNLFSDQPFFVVQSPQSIANFESIMVSQL